MRPSEALRVYCVSQPSSAPETSACSAPSCTARIPKAARGFSGGYRGTTLLDVVRLQNAIKAELGVPVDVLTAGDLPAKFRDRLLRETRPL